MFKLSNKNTAASVTTSKFFNKTGIYPVVFKGWSKDAFDSKKGEHFELLVAKFEGTGEFAGKEYDVKIFEPEFTERKKGQYGYECGKHEEPLNNIIYILNNTSDAYRNFRKEGKEVNSETWDEFRDEIIKFNDGSIGVETNIKLIARANKDGYINCSIPSFNLSFTKDQNEKQGRMILDGEIEPYMKSKWLGKELVFTKAEIKAMNAETAKPTSMDDLLASPTQSFTPTMEAPKDDFADILTMGL